MQIRRLIPRTHDRPTPDTSLAIVNIVLLLIFFFLITGQLTTQPAIPVELSETAELPIEALPEPVLIWEDAGEMTLDGDPITADELAEALADRTRLHLLIDRNESAQVLIDLLARPDFAHLDISLVTIHRRGEP